MTDEEWGVMEAARLAAVGPQTTRPLGEFLAELRAPAKFPPIVLAEDMHRECVRDGWQMAPHPILKLRGSDHG